MGTVTDFIFLGSKITADGDCSHEIKRCLLLGRKVVTNLDSILKSRDITLPTKVCLVKTMDSPVGWDRKGGRRGDQVGGTHVHPWLTHINVLYHIIYQLYQL